MNSFSNYKIKCVLPSKKKIYVDELTNKQYFNIQQYLLGGDYQGFMYFMNSLIHLTSEEIQKLDILDMMFIYITIYAHSIKSFIEINDKNKNISNFLSSMKQYNLFESLEKIQNNFIEDEQILLETKIGTIECTIGIPNSINFKHDVPTIEIESALKRIKHNDKLFLINYEQHKDIIENILSIDNYEVISKLVYEKFNPVVSLLPNILEFRIMDSSFFSYYIDFLFKSNIMNLVDLKCTLLKHMNISFSDYENLSPIMAELLLVKMVNDMEAEKNKSNKKPNLTI